MEPQLKNKDRIKILKEIYGDPNFTGSFVDVLRFARKKLFDNKELRLESIRKKIYSRVSPRGYDQALRRMSKVFFPEDLTEERNMNLEEIIQTKKDQPGYYDYYGKLQTDYVLENGVARRVEDNPTREDSWRMYLGLPQKYNSFVESEYKPSKAKDPNVVYYKYGPKAVTNYGSLISEQAHKTNLKGILDRYGGNVDYLIAESKETGSALYTQESLGNTKIEKGEDEKGKYISIYDRWDLHPFPKFIKKDLGELTKVGKPWEYYDRYYYEPN